MAQRNSTPRGRTTPQRRRSSSAKRSSASSRRSSTSRSSAASRQNGNARVVAARETLTKGVHSVASGAQSARDTVASGAKTTGNALGTATQKARVPAVASGAALAGLAGGLAIASRGGRRRILGVPVPGTRRPLIKVTAPRRSGMKGVRRDLTKAARQAGELASEVRLVRQQLEGSRRRSPIEVVLEGLTSRRVPS
jgi:hypothetical protein